MIVRAREAKAALIFYQSSLVTALNARGVEGVAVFLFNFHSKRFVLRSTMATTEEQVAQYEEMFSKRFTSEDAEYMKTVNKPQASPPCLADWISTGYRDG